MTQQSPKNTLLLASTSPYRKMLLERLGIPFETRSPNVDESPLAGENPDQLVERLALAKAQAVAEVMPSSIVIGSDQLAAFDGRVIGKPGNMENARRQLASFSGKQVLYLTSFVVLESDTGRNVLETVQTIVNFRVINNREISRYLELDQPLDCAGSFKSECAGISLFESLRSEDPTALIGLPLIRLGSALRKFGFQVP